MLETFLLDFCGSTYIVQKMTVSVSWHVLMHYGFVVQRGNL